MAQGAQPARTGQHQGLHRERLGQLQDGRQLGLERGLGIAREGRVHEEKADEGRQRPVGSRTRDLARPEVRKPGPCTGATAVRARDQLHRRRVLARGLLLRACELFGGLGPASVLGQPPRFAQPDLLLFFNQLQFVDHRPRGLQHLPRAI